MMKSSIILALVASAIAQTTTSSAQTAVQTCIAECEASDVNCKALCVGVPHPGSSEMDAATHCVADCSQGDGSAAQNDAYAVCQNACISSYIFPGGVAPTGTGPTPTDAARVTSAGAYTTTVTTMLADYGSILSSVIVSDAASAISSASSHVESAGSMGSKIQSSVSSAVRGFVSSAVSRGSSLQSVMSTLASNNIAAPTVGAKIGEAAGALGVAFAAFAML